MRLLLLPILLLAIAVQKDVAGYRILGIFPLNGKSHWVMKEQLMKALARKGHQVDVYTHFLQKKPIPNYREISLVNTFPSPVNNMSATDIQAFGGLSMKQLTYIAGDQMCELLMTPQFQELIKNPPKDPPYDMAIIEVFVAPCFLALGRHLNIPVVGTLTCVFHDWLNDKVGNPFNTAYVPSLFSEFTPYMNFWDRLKNTLLSTVVSTQINYYLNQQHRYVKKAFGEHMPPITDYYEDLSLLLVNSHHSLTGIRPMTPAVVEVGGLHLHDEDEPLSPEVKKWLDESKHGCVYFTFGSMVRIETFPKEVVEKFYATFRKIAPVRVLMKIAKKEDLLPGLPENVMTQPWFPQLSVLKHKNVRIFLTHGGLMGTQEAIYSGVPMIGIPLFGDQRINLNTYVQKKVAILIGSIDELTEEKLTAAIKKMLSDPSYTENVKKLSKAFLDRPMSAVDTAVYWVEYVGRNGNALQSPAIRLNWWQRNLIDVYGFIVLCVAVVLYVVLFVLCKVRRYLFGSKPCSRRNDTATKSKKNK